MCKEQGCASKLFIALLIIAKSSLSLPGKCAYNPGEIAYDGGLGNQGYIFLTAMV